jgi:dTDP-4-dehydrorhamnose 3,5-epimerase
MTKKLIIKDVNLISLAVNVDDRGYLLEVIRTAEPKTDPWSVCTRFSQVYLVGNFGKGTIRAFHKHKLMWDYFFISHGAAKFVLADDRKNSLTYKEINTFILSERNPSLLVVPPEVYHGWMSLEDDTQMICIASELYNREKPDEIRIPPDSFGDVWTVKGR